MAVQIMLWCNLTMIKIKFLIVWYIIIYEYTGSSQNGINMYHVLVNTIQSSATIWQDTGQMSSLLYCQ